MTVAIGRNLALSVFGAAGVAAAAISAVLIWAIVTGPDQLAMAMTEGSAWEVLKLAVNWIVALVARAFGAA